MVLALLVMGLQYNWPCSIFSGCFFFPFAVMTSVIMFHTYKALDSRLLIRNERNQSISNNTESIATFINPRRAESRKKTLLDTAYVGCADSALALPLDAPFVNTSGALWIVHYSKAAERRARLERLLAKFPKIAVNWLDTFDRDQMTSEVCRCLFHKKYQDCSKPINYGTANSWAQYALYLHIVKANLDYAFVMEDDPQFKTKISETNFGDDLTNMMAAATSILGDRFDMIHFGGCFNIHGTIPLGGRFWKLKGNKFGRCTNGYVVSRRGAEKMLSVFENSSYKRIWGNVDWMFNFLGGPLSLDVAMYEPPLFNNPKPGDGRGH